VPASHERDPDAVTSLITRISNGGRLRLPSKYLEELNPPAASSVENGPRFYAIQKLGAPLCFYRRCDGKKFWRPNVPETLAPAGTQLIISLRFLTSEFFVENLGRIVFLSNSKVRWAPKMVEMTLEESTSKSGVTLRIRQGTSSSNLTFNVEAVLERLESRNGIPRLLVKVHDFFGKSKELAFYHNGNGHPILRIKDGRQFRTVKLVFSDGIRLIIAYSKFRGLNLSTSYLKSPSELYSIVSEENPTFCRQQELPQSYVVEILRPRERRMLYEGTTYEHGRLGAEIAHTIAMKFLGLKNPVIGEPSSGGKDLWTQDHTFTVQARLIADFTQFYPLTAAEAISQQLTLLVRKLGQDFANSPMTHTGFVIFSYLDDHKTLHSLVLKRVRKPHKFQP
jgi:hypothetical protein